MADSKTTEVMAFQDAARAYAAEHSATEEAANAKLAELTTRGCWVTHPWNGWTYSAGTNPAECLARAERSRTLKIAELQSQIEAIKKMPLVVEYVEAVTDDE